MPRDSRADALPQALAVSSLGDASPARELLPLVYEHLRQLAALRVSQEGPGQTLQATALVHEAYLRITKAGQGARSGEEPGAARSADPKDGSPNDGSPPCGRWVDKDHFFAAAARAMRHILIERARAKGTLKRGGDRGRVNLVEEMGSSREPGRLDADLIDWIAVDEALAALEREDAGLARIVSLRFFAGLTAAETAAIVGTSERTVHRDWQVARGWMLRFLSRSDGAGGRDGSCSGTPTS